MKVQLLLSLTFVVSYGVSEQTYDYLCVNKHGDYLAHPSDCSKFLHCSHRRAYEFKCPGNLLWHQKVKSCDYQYRTKCEHESNATRAKLKTKQNSATTVKISKLSPKETLVSTDKISKLLITDGDISELSTEGNPIISNDFLKGNAITSKDILELSTKGNSITSEDTLELSTKGNSITSDKFLESLTKGNPITSDEFLELSTEENTSSIENILKISKDESIVIANKSSELIAKESAVSAGHIPEISTTAETITESKTLPDDASFTADGVSEISMEAETVTIGTVSIRLRDSVSFTADDASELSTEANTSTFGTVTELSTDLNTESPPGLFVATYTEQILNNVTADYVSEFSTEFDVLTTGITESSIKPEAVDLTEQYMESFSIDISDQLVGNITADNVSEADTLTTEFATESSIADTVVVTMQQIDVLTEKNNAELSTEAEILNLLDQQLSTKADFIHLKETLTEKTTAGQFQVATIPDIVNLTAANAFDLSTEANSTNFKQLFTDNTTAINLNISKLLTETDTVNLTAGSDLQISTKDTSITTKNVFEIMEYLASTTTTPTTLTVNTDNSFSENLEHSTSQDKIVIKLQGKNLGYVQINETISTTASTITTSASTPAIDTITQDPRLPFRAIECQGENNRHQFKAMECYQYYQCFAGWAFLLNCREGWRFADEMAGCIQDVDKKCGY